MAQYTLYLDPKGIEKIQIYQAKGRYTAAQLKSRIGCDYIINGGLYTMATMKPNCKLKVEGIVVESDQWNYMGPVWSTPLDFSFKNMDPKCNIVEKNGIACVCMKYNGTVSDYAIDGAQNNSAMGYATSRTAIGKKDGKIALYIGNTAMRPRPLFNYLNGLGWSDILMLDGGGSTQGDLGPGKKITSSRKVHNYICIFMKKDSVVPPPDLGDFENGKNPYQKPTRTLQYGAVGNDVRWAQYQLNVHDVTCDVDGSFGPAMLAAVKKFQANHGLAVDGSCGPDTRNTLAKNHPDDCMSDVEGGENPYPKPTRAIRYYTTGNDVRWVQFQLNKFGYNVDIDGSYGPDMVSKIKEFQSDHGLAVDGSCGPATQAALAKK